MEDSRVVPRRLGTPQGGVISPLLANLFLHYAFDVWMARKYPHIPFERYADDIVCHCKSAEARKRCAVRCGIALQPAGWNCIPRRRRSSIARMRTGEATMLNVF